MNFKIADVKRTILPSNKKLTVAGHTLMAGTPSDLMIRFEGEGNWRRVMMMTFGDKRSYFVRIGNAKITVTSAEICKVLYEKENDKSDNC